MIFKEPHKNEVMVGEVPGYLGETRSRSGFGILLGPLLGQRFSLSWELVLVVVGSRIACFPVFPVFPVFGAVLEQCLGGDSVVYSPVSRPQKRSQTGGSITKLPLRAAW